MADATTDAPQSAAPAPLPAGRKNRRRKAAIIVHLALSRGIPLALDRFPPALHSELAHEIAALKTVDRGTLLQAVNEFVAELEGLGLVSPADLDAAMALLGPALGNEAGERLRTTLSASAPDPWVRLGETDSACLAKALQEEAPQVAAIALSKLKVARAAEVLGHLPGPLARSMTLAMARLGPVSPATVERIGAALAGRIDAQPTGAFDAPAAKRVGSVLNAATAATRNDMLDGLSNADKNLADEVRRAIFTFVHIPERMDPRDVPKITRELSQEHLARAIAGAREGPEAEAGSFILENMSNRMAQQLKDEVAAIPEMQPAEAEAAMAEVTTAIRELEDRGELRLLNKSG